MRQTRDKSQMTVENSDTTTDGQMDLLYGAGAIAQCLELTEAQTRHLIAMERIPVFRIGAIICSRTSRLARWLEQQMPTD